MAKGSDSAAMFYRRGLAEQALIQSQPLLPDDIQQVQPPQRRLPAVSEQASPERLGQSPLYGTVQEATHYRAAIVLRLQQAVHVEQQLPAPPVQEKPVGAAAGSDGLQDPPNIGNGRTDRVHPRQLPTWERVCSWQQLPLSTFCRHQR